MHQSTFPHPDDTIKVIDEKKQELTITGTLPVCSKLCTDYMESCGYNQDKCLTGFTEVFAADSRTLHSQHTPKVAASSFLILHFDRL